MFIYKSILLLLITVTTLQLNTAYCADIYKWTDEQGVVHFGDRPDNTENSATQPATLYKVPKNNTANVSSSNKERAIKQQKLLDSFQADRRAKKELRDKKRKQAKNKKYNCQVATDKLKRYQNASKIYVRNEVGEKVYLDDKQRQQETELMNQQMIKWCN